MAIIPSLLYLQPSLLYKLLPVSWSYIPSMVPICISSLTSTVLHSLSLCSSHTVLPVGSRHAPSCLRAFAQALHYG